LAIERKWPRDNKTCPRGDPKLKHWATSPAFLAGIDVWAKAQAYLRSNAKLSAQAYLRSKTDIIKPGISEAKGTLILGINVSQKPKLLARAKLCRKQNCHKQKQHDGNSIRRF
jgi:hypothetical protein